jgi:hypothetical protein
MRASRPKRAIPLLAAAHAATLVTAFAQNQSPLVLQLKAHVGDSYTMDFQSTTRSVDSKGVEQRIAAASTLQTKVEAVAPSGRMTLRRETRITRFWIRIWQHDTLIVDFDSDKSADRDAARKDADGAQILALLDKPVTIRLEQEPTGELHGADVAEGPASQILEQVMTQGVFSLPDHPVRIGDEWDGGKWSVPLKGFGRLDMSRKLTFASIDVRNGEFVAMLKGRDAITIRADLDSSASATIKTGSVDELYLLAIDRGRVVGARIDCAMTLEVAQSGQHSPAQVEIKAVLKERR